MAEEELRDGMLAALVAGFSCPAWGGGMIAKVCQCNHRVSRSPAKGGGMKVAMYGVFAALVLGGCASNSGVVPMSADTYFISKQAATGFTGLGTLRGDAMREAYAQCSKTGKSVQVTDTTESKPPYLLGNFPRVDITFRCVSE